MIQRHLSVDNTRNNRINEIITQKEHGVTLFEIKCLNNGYDIDLTECTQAQFYSEKSDGHIVCVKCDFNEDKTAILLPLILQMSTAPGILRGVLELSFGSGNIRFSGINFKVISAPDDAEIESTDEFTIFERCLLKPKNDGKVGQVLAIGSDGENEWQDQDYNQLGVADNPFIFEIGVKLIPNAYYIYNNERYVYAGTEVSTATVWDESNFEKF